MPEREDSWSTADRWILALVMLASLALYGPLAWRLAQGAYLDYYNLAFDFDPIRTVSALTASPPDFLNVKHPLFVLLRPLAWPLLLLGALLGMIFTYLVAPVAVLTLPLHHSWPAAALGLVTWGLIAFAYQPTLRLYGKPAAHGLLLPVVGFLYSLMTVASAVRHWRGRGGQWKGRTYQAGGDGATASGAGRNAE